MSENLTKTQTSVLNGNKLSIFSLSTRQSNPSWSEEHRAARPFQAQTTAGRSDLS